VEGIDGGLDIPLAYGLGETAQIGTRPKVVYRLNEGFRDGPIISGQQRLENSLLAWLASHYPAPPWTITKSIMWFLLQGWGAIRRPLPLTPCSAAPLLDASGQAMP
jgi:hypothetical protein